MSKKGYKQTEEHKRKISLANAISLCKECHDKTKRGNKIEWLTQNLQQIVIVG